MPARYSCRCRLCRSDRTRVRLTIERRERLEAKRHPESALRSNGFRFRQEVTESRSAFPRVGLTPRSETFWSITAVAKLNFLGMAARLDAARKLGLNRCGRRANRSH